MTYVKLSNNIVVFPKKTEIYNGKMVCNPTPEQLIEMGFKEYVLCEPEQREGYYPVLTHTETPTQIIQVWEYEESPQPPKDWYGIDMN